MKKLMTVLLAAILCLGLAGVAMAGNTEVYVWVEVEESVALDVPPQAYKTIVEVEAGSDYVSVETYTEGGFRFSHNHPNDMKVTAKADAQVGAENDIFLSVYISGSYGGWTTIVYEGADLDPVVVWQGPAGAYNETIGGAASATLAGTPHGWYEWTVTFTATDA